MRIFWRDRVRGNGWGKRRGAANADGSIAFYRRIELRMMADGGAKAFSLEM